MSARGARSRKAVAKDIEKKEKKAEKHNNLDTNHRQYDAFADWKTSPSPTPYGAQVRAPPRPTTISTSTSGGTSRSSSNNPNQSRPRVNNPSSHDSSDISGRLRRQASVSGSASVVSDGSSQGKEKTKYKSHGKETKAPRGRGGGVPVRKPTTPAYPSTPVFRIDTSASSHAPPGKKTWINFRTWGGGGSGPQFYGGFECDEHMQNGSVLIYFKEEQMSDEHPIPQIRADLDILENAGSTWLSNALMYGRIDDLEDHWAMTDHPQSPEHNRSLSSYGFPQPPGQHDMLTPTVPNATSPPPFHIDQEYFGVPRNRSGSAAQHYGDAERPTGYRSPSPAPVGRQQQPTHEIWFTAPERIRTPQGQRLHHVAIRNFIAILHDKPIVGADLVEMLSTLQPEIQVMYDLDHDYHSEGTPQERSIQMITDYLRQHKLDDVRSGIKTVLGLLAWAEQDHIRWRRGYLESFVHLAGILSPQIEDLPDFRRLSIATRKNLGFAAKTLELRILDVEDKLSSFDFNDLWTDSPTGAYGPVYESFAAFRQFLLQYYGKVYGEWPPRHGKASWLNRKIVRELQEDFGALYDYLVNRDVVWDSREERPGKKWEMVDKKSDDFKADEPGLSLTDMFVTFDSKHGFLHIPHPYPLLPRDVPTMKAPPQQKKSLFGSKKKNKTETTKDAKTHLQLSIIFSDATNINKKDIRFEGCTLLDHFERFELAADLQNTTPREARLGRWILLYATLQVLSTISVDVEGLRFTNGVPYFLCSDLRRCPEWVTDGQPEFHEGSQLRSYCWQRPWGHPSSNSTTRPAELEGSHLPDVREMEGTPSPLDGATMLDRDIQRISEKIEYMGRQAREPHKHMYDKKHGYENDKMKREEFGVSKGIDGSYRLAESDFATRRPSVPMRSPRRSATNPRDALGRTMGLESSYGDDSKTWI
ncbi:hypothetical protein BU24DRAFT_36724 [Aaosphaeria arxii CBS 175.79]|uniref:DUF8004 domain-containing protein n=1 Tax=Aaosphaeria arxii CBS 175.79 TaxID=1450172 RepID=A0A6A5YBJ0_9PLEO|nr:uncharacterized protein BU24DRAFT_36724 [Aaosphaeria arxii CBS 175.79]KAF2022060.1 hypothetical protein BU24DRAFT_36724 [Aaosphaeria arxii CBS 175.79]